MREAPPPYRGEGPHALWHVSEDDSIRRFEPREGRVWAIETRLLPLNWVPRDCPRATLWAESGTTDDDVERFLGGGRTRRVHAVEPLELVELRDLVVRHEAAAIELRTEEELIGFWDDVIASSLGYSGIRLRNARVRT